MNKDLNHPWFRPVWRRVLIVALCLALAGWDLSNGEHVWALIFGGLGGYAIYIFFITWQDDTSEKDESK